MGGEAGEKMEEEIKENRTEKRGRERGGMWRKWREGRRRGAVS